METTHCRGDAALTGSGHAGRHPRDCARPEGGGRCRALDRRAACAATTAQLLIALVRTARFTTLPTRQTQAREFCSAKQADPHARSREALLSVRNEDARLLGSAGLLGEGQWCDGLRPRRLGPRWGHRAFRVCRSGDGSHARTYAPGAAANRATHCSEQNQKSRSAKRRLPGRRVRIHPLATDGIDDWVTALGREVEHEQLHGLEQVA